MSDGSSQEVVLENNQELELNKKTAVSFEIDGVYYRADVTLLKQSAALKKEIKQARTDFFEANDIYDQAHVNLLNAIADLREAMIDGTDEEISDAQLDFGIAQIEEVRASGKRDLALTKLNDLLNNTKFAVAYEEALAAVEKAERSNKQVDWDAADYLVSRLDGSDPKTALRERLDYVEVVIEAYDEIGHLEDAIEAEDYVDASFEHGFAFDAIEELRDGDLKIDLEARLEAAEEAIAEHFTSWAEEELEEDAPNFNKVRNRYNAGVKYTAFLEDGAAKTALEDRLTVIKAALDKADAEYIAEGKVADAEYQVGRDNNLAQQYHDEAKALVAQLEAGDVRTALYARLTDVQQTIDDNAVELAAKADLKDTIDLAQDLHNNNNVAGISDLNSAIIAANSVFIDPASTTEDFEDAEVELSDAIYAYEVIIEDYAAAQPVQDMIAAFPLPATLADERAVEAARLEYEALTTEQQALVTNIAALELREDQIRVLKDIQQAKDDLDAVVLTFGDLSSTNQKILNLPVDYDWSTPGDLVDISGDTVTITRAFGPAVRNLEASIEVHGKTVTKKWTLNIPGMGTSSPGYPEVTISSEAAVVL